MKTEVRTPIKIVVAGMGERSSARMATLFKIVYKGRCEFAQGKDAILGIVDLDGEADAWNEFRQQYPTLPAIVMSESPASVDGAVYVAKPAKLDLLWDAIFNLVTGLPSPDEIPAPVIAEKKAPTVCTTADAITNRTKTTRGGLQEGADCFYNPDDYLLGHILSSLNKHAGRQCAIHIQCWKERQLILLPGQGKAYTNLTDNQFKNLGMPAFKGFATEIKALYSADKDELPASDSTGLQSTSIDHLIWNLALRTARGRVPLGTDLSASLYLQHWPNFPRLPHTPYDMRITSLWVDNPRTLDSIAANLGIEPAEVYSFYSAAAAIGLAGSANRQVDGLIAPKNAAKKETSKRGFLASILRRISQ